MVSSSHHHAHVWYLQSPPRSEWKVSNKNASQGWGLPPIHAACYENLHIPQHTCACLPGIPLQVSFESTQNDQPALAESYIETQQGPWSTTSVSCSPEHPAPFQTCPASVTHVPVPFLLRDTWMRTPFLPCNLIYSFALYAMGIGSMRFHHSIVKTNLGGFGKLVYKQHVCIKCLKLGMVSLFVFSFGAPYINVSTVLIQMKSIST